MSDWWDGVPPAESRVRCGGQEHRLRWSAGELRALDHDDLEGERTLAALGGERCECVEIVDLWREHSTQLRILVLASRGASDPIAPRRDDDEEDAFGARRVMVHTVARDDDADADDESLDDDEENEDWEDEWDDTEQRDPVARLLRLGGGLPARLVATAAASWAERLANGPPPSPAEHAALHAALYGQLTCCAREWLSDPEVSVALTMIGPDEPRRVERAGTELIVDLPFAWLAEVSARGLATLAGRFCLAAARSSPTEWSLSVVDAVTAAPAALTLAGASGVWSPPEI